jgi:AcrR family transcriptional regulator
MGSRPTGDRRTALLGAAAELFAERGYRSVLIDDIGRAVGTTGPALYRHFSGKQALLGAILIDVSERLARRGRELAAAAPDPGAALTALLRGHIAFALDEPALITVHDRELHHLTEGDRRRVRRLQRGYVEEWVGVLSQVRPHTPAPVLRAAVHAVFGLLNSTPHSRGELPRTHMAELLLVMGAAALTAPDTPVDGTADGTAGSVAIDRGH